MNYIFYYYRLPFNWKAPLGYFFASILGCISVYTIICSILPVLCLTFGSYWLYRAIIKDIILDYRILNDKASDINRKETLELFHKVIEDISDAKQLSDRFQYTIFQIHHEFIIISTQIDKRLF